MAITLAEVFPPGEYLRDELSARGWTQEEFAEIIGRSFKQVNELLSGKAALSAPMAQAIAAALGTSADVWMALEASYRLSLVEPTSEAIARRARLRNEFPVRELQKRGWIPKTNDMDKLEAAVCEFYQINSLEARLDLAHAAKRTSYDSELTRIQEAVLLRVHALANQVEIEAFAPDKVGPCLSKLRRLMRNAADIQQVPAVLAEAGIRYVVCEAFAGSKLDGLCTWLDDSKPVVAMTLRHDRIDNFWFVLRHELEHVIRGDGKDESSGQVVIDDDLGAGDTAELPARERVANEAAAEFLVPQQQLREFIVSAGAVLSKTLVAEFANSLGIHPGILVGQLQRALQRWNLFRPWQVKIRQFITTAATTDGFGNVAA